MTDWRILAGIPGIRPASSTGCRPSHSPKTLKENPSLRFREKVFYFRAAIRRMLVDPAATATPAPLATAEALPQARKLIECRIKNLAAHLKCGRSEQRSPRAII